MVLLIQTLSNLQKLQYDPDPSNCAIHLHVPISERGKTKGECLKHFLHLTACIMNKRLVIIHDFKYHSANNET